jgi:hypothetical protein
MSKRRNPSDRANEQLVKSSVKVIPGKIGAKNERSGVWDHFGALHDENGVIDQEKHYCVHCVENFKAGRTRAAQIWKYSIGTGTSSLTQHLERKHKIHLVRSLIHSNITYYKTHFIIISWSFWFFNLFYY